MSGGIFRGHGGGLEIRLADLERKFRDLTGPTAAGTIASLGTVTLTADGVATSTVKADANVSASSIILPVASSSGGWSVDAGITGITAGAGSFTVSHSASTLTRTFNYIAINPA